MNFSFTEGARSLALTSVNIQIFVYIWTTSSSEHGDFTYLCLYLVFLCQICRLRKNAASDLTASFD